MNSLSKQCSKSSRFRLLDRHSKLISYPEVLSLTIENRMGTEAQGNRYSPEVTHSCWRKNELLTIFQNNFLNIIFAGYFHTPCLCDSSKIFFIFFFFLCFRSSVKVTCLMGMS